MTCLWIVIGLVALGGLIAVAFLAIAVYTYEERYPKVCTRDFPEFKKHVAYMCRAFGDGGHGYLHVPGLAGPLDLKKSVFKTKPGVLTLRITAGHVGRDVVERFLEYAESQGMQHKSRYSPKRQLLRDVRISWEADDPSAPDQIARTLEEGVAATGLSFRGNCTIHYLGPIDPAYVPADDDPEMTPPEPTRTAAGDAGYKVGFYVAIVVKCLAIIIGTAGVIIVAYRLLG